MGVHYLLIFQHESGGFQVEGCGALDLVAVAEHLLKLAEGQGGHEHAPEEGERP